MIKRFIFPFLLILIVGTLSFFLINRSTHPVSKTTFDYNPQQEAEKIYSNCQGKDLNICYPESFGELTKVSTLPLALTTLHLLQDLDPSSRGCHLIAHYIAISETLKKPNRWKDLISTLDPNECGGGFIHGVLEAHWRVDHFFQLNANSLNDICEYVDSKAHQKGAESSCDHIMGHILLSVENADIDKAVHECEKVAPKYRFGCSTGVFMENLTRENLVAHGLAQPLKWDEETTKKQETLCQNYSGETATGCWREMAHLYSSLANLDPYNIHQLCLKAPTKDSQNQCYYHSIDISMASSHFSSNILPKICSFYSSDNLKGCIDRLVHGATSVTPKYADRVINFCQILSNDPKYYCFTKLGQSLANLVSLSERENLCHQVPDEYKNLCQRS